jgi:hypothetical protein
VFVMVESDRTSSSGDRFSLEPKEMSQQQHYPVLKSKHGHVWLVGVTIEGDRVTCEFAYFDSGLGESIRIMPIEQGKQDQVFELEIPQQIRKSLNYVLITDINQMLKFSLVHR